MNSANAKAACKSVIDNAELIKSAKPSGKSAAIASIEQALSVLEEEFGIKAGKEVKAAEKKEEKAAVENAHSVKYESPVSVPEGKPKKYKKPKPTLGKLEKSRYMKEVNITKEQLKDVSLQKKSRKLAVERVPYTLYSTNEYGKYANRFFEKLTIGITSAYKQQLAGFYKALRASGIKVLSKTYISMIFLSSVIAFIAVALLASVFFSAPNIIIQVLRGIMLGVLAAGITAAVMYFYPSSVAKTRESAIKEDLPFVIINMAAVAGSGAKPISLFKTILSSEEYPGLRDEIKKIVNYVALFGYDLSTALRAVARDTPSLRFKDLLDGIVNTIESGGDLKEYLNAMADEALTTYRLERKKAVEQVGTYSDIYTTILIAAPLLFFVTLAIIQTMGGELGGMSVATLATFGTYLVIPMLNIGFIIFINAVQPK